MPWLGIDVFWYGMHSDPRLADLLRQSKSSLDCGTSIGGSFNLLAHTHLCQQLQVRSY